ncbi:MAG: DUF933 domain-containing protein [Desulfobacterales bacterium]
MKVGIIGLPGSGKSTIFQALVQQGTEIVQKGPNRIGTVRVPDVRVDELQSRYRPKKTIYAQVEYFLPGVPGHKKETIYDQTIWPRIRESDALIHVVRNFIGIGLSDPTPDKDFYQLDQELVFADLVILEKRLERLLLDKKRGVKNNPEELNLLMECQKLLNNGIPLRKGPEVSSSRLLKGYAFVSAKPVLVLFNNEDENDQLPKIANLTGDEDCMVIRGKLEQELSQMPDEEAKEFLKEFNIPASAMARVIKRSYTLLGLLSFFTVGSDEVKAWTIKAGTKAVDAAGAIHSDIKKGFIRAEVLSYDDLIDAGSYQEAKKRGTLRLEGKNYMIMDGDIIEFRFNI